MRTVFALSSARSIAAILAPETNALSWLCSYLYAPKSEQNRETAGSFNVMVRWVQEHPDTDRPRLMILDSGAFSAWSLGRTIDLDAYRAHAVRSTERLPGLHVVNLDVIPGEKGRSSTAAEREQGMARSLEHADSLRAAGLKVMEVFHQDEPVEFLWHLCERRKPGELLGISPRNDQTTAARCRWLTSLLGTMVARFGRDGLPPCHGLAATAPSFMQTFPFFSVDSAAWFYPISHGRMRDAYGRIGMVDELLYRRPGVSTKGKGERWPVNTTALRQSIRNTLAIERTATTLWARRGIVWPDEAP